MSEATTDSSVHQFPDVKTRGGRAKGEAIPGMAALANHAHRHETPGILAQTKTLQRTKHALVSSAMGNPHNRVAVDLMTSDRQLDEAIDSALSQAKQSLQPSSDAAPETTQDLSAEPAAATVNGQAREKPALILDVVRISLGTGLMLTLPDDVSPQIGRLGKPVIIADEDSIQFSFPSTEKGYQWSPYKKNTDRLTIIRERVDLPDNVPDFGLSVAEDVQFTADEGLSLTIRRSSLQALRFTPPEVHKGPRASPTPSPGRGPIFRIKGSVTTGDPSENDLPVSDQQIKAALGILNTARKDRGESIRYHLDEQGYVRAKVIVERDL